MNAYLNINHGNGSPFLDVSTRDAYGNQAYMFIHEITPAKLRALADDLERLITPQQCPLLEITLQDLTQEEAS